jgi:hypothetical protein|tara:strand:+ start:184 stop:1140 length:957 start_codon:yes stop_codon:yes gene_type:complete
MANKDLFKQAIAEAKSIREAAIANAKEALEESLTPHLKDMLAAKLQEMDDSSMEEEVAIDETEEVTEVEAYEGESKDGEHAMEEVEDDSEESEDETDDAGEEAEEAGEDEEEVEVKDMEVDDLKDLIRDIISQEMGSDDEIDNSDMDAGAEMEPEMDLGADVEGDEEIDLDELLAELEAASEGQEVEEEVVAEEEVKEEDNSELNEALETITTLQSQLQEVNLLNAKLMYVNKVFKVNNLSEAQKVNIIAAFDKAETVKEVKLVFETVSENVIAKPTAIKESKLGMASKATGTTAKKPEVISEVSDAVKRMQKLAGII